MLSVTWQQVQRGKRKAVIGKPLMEWRYCFFFSAPSIFLLFLLLYFSHAFEYFQGRDRLYANVGMW